MQDQVVIIVGAGPGGLAAASGLTLASIPYTLLERDDCYAPMWKKRAYDRLHLHLAKPFCELPYMPYPPNYPKFVSKHQFIQYLDDYVAHFNIRPMCNRNVKTAQFDDQMNKWYVKVKNCTTDETEEYVCRFLIVATGENTDPFVPNIDGLETFTGEYLHTTKFKNGQQFKGKSVLVVGSGNSGLEIAYDLSSYGAKTSIVVKSKMHFVTREMIYFGLILFNFLPFSFVDRLLVLLSKIKYGDLSKYGIHRPELGPYTSLVKNGKYPSFDVGICAKIKSGEVQVYPAVESIRGNEVEFENGKSNPFDVIIFATGFERSTNKWLKGDEYLLGEDGIPKHSYPNHWKGQNGLYCVGLSRKGLYGIKEDVLDISKDLKNLVVIN